MTTVPTFTVPQHDRYRPLVPCPWRHDPSLKPSASVTPLDMDAEVEWFMKKWDADLSAITQHITYDLDSWYQHALGICEIKYDPDKTEAVVQKLLKQGADSLTYPEAKLVQCEHVLPNSYHLSLNELVAYAEEKKCLSSSPLFYEAFLRDPFHTRHMHKLDPYKLITQPVCSSLLPSQFDELHVTLRRYTEMESRLLRVFQDIFQRSLSS